MDDAMVPSGATQGFNIDALLEISRNNAVSVTGLIQQVTESSKTLDEMSNKVDVLTDKMEMRERAELISPSQKKILRAAVGRQIYRTLGIKRKNGKIDVESKRVRNVYGGLFFSRLYGDLCEEFDVGSYEEIRAIDFDRAMDFIKSWEPEGGLDMLKSEAEENWNVNHPDTPVNEYLGRLGVQ